MSQQRIAAYAWIEQDGKVLLCRLSENMKDSVGKWTLPGGGIEFGEAPPDAAIREAKEETGLDIELEGLIGVDSRVYRMPRKLQAIRIIYRAKVVGGEISAEVDGTTDLAAWVPRSEIRSATAVDLVLWTAQQTKRSGKRRRRRRPRHGDTPASET